MPPGNRYCSCHVLVTLAKVVRNNVPQSHVDQAQQQGKLQVQSRVGDALNNLDSHISSRGMLNCGNLSPNGGGFRR